MGGWCRGFIFDSLLATDEKRRTSSFYRMIVQFQELKTVESGHEA